MRIIHVIPSLMNGGAERLVIDIVQALHKRDGIEVRLVLLHNHIAYNIKPIQDLVHVIPATVKLSVLKAHQFEIEELQGFINDFKPNVIHTHLFEAEIVTKSCTYPKAVWFCHFHDNMPQLENLGLKTLVNKKYLLNFFEKLYLFKRTRINCAAFYIAISKNAEAYAKQVVMNASNVFYLKNAIDYQNFFHPIKTYTIGNTLKLINVGSFQKKKNQQFLMDVLVILKSRNIPVTLELLGDGIERSAVESRASSLGLNSSVQFLGNVKNVPAYLSKADIYIHSAYYEPFGLVLLEAMAAGLPVITLNGGGNLDIMNDGKNGFVIDEQEPILFADVIENLLNNKDLFKTIALEGQETAKQYDIENYTSSLLALYNKALL